MSNTWFAGLPEVARDDILAQARRRVLTSGQRLYSRGDPSDGVYGVLEGSVRVSGTSRAGREAVLDFFGPGSLIGEISTLDGGPRTHDARAYGPTLLLQVSPADFEDLLARHRALSRMLLRLKAKRLRILLGWIEATSTQPQRQRIASRLLMLATAHRAPAAEGLTINLQLSQENLAQLVGTTRQRVNQILKTWESEGVIEQRSGRILVLNRGRLKTLARE